jgi:hypothetical protein
VFFRAFFALPVIMAWLALRHELHRRAEDDNPMSHVWRGLVGTTAMGLMLYGPRPSAAAGGHGHRLRGTYPRRDLRGDVPRRKGPRLPPVDGALGLAGVLVVLSPRLQVDPTTADATQTLGAVMVLLCGRLRGAGAGLRAQDGADRKHLGHRVLLLADCHGHVVLTLPWGWACRRSGSWHSWCCRGFWGAIGQILLTSSYRHADASLIAPFEYASMLLAIIVGYVVFSEVPTQTMLTGAGMIVTAGILIIWRERQLGLERARQRKAGNPQN